MTNREGWSLIGLSKVPLSLPPCMDVALALLLLPLYKQGAPSHTGGPGDSPVHTLLHSLALEGSPLKQGEEAPCTHKASHGTCSLCGVPSCV